MGISCEQLNKIFQENGLDYFTGVPDSTFKGWMSYLANHETTLTHRIAANEGAAIAHAAGYYLSTGKVGVVYLQNSGLGNCVNPLTSLADNDVYGIPMMLLIGWRGEPGIADEPQHKKMGRVMPQLLKALEIPYEIAELKSMAQQVRQLKEKAVKSGAPVALIIRQDVVEDYKRKAGEGETAELLREEAIHTIAGLWDEETIIVATTGKTSRELFEYQQAKNGDHSRNFYTVGSMGHASAIALEIAKQASDKRVVIFDGDGALIMHMGNLATIGHYAPENLVHIVFDNASHESTGGQKTVSESLDLVQAALACSYRSAVLCDSKDELTRQLKQRSVGPVFIAVKVKKGSRKDLGRPTLSPKDIKNGFLTSLIQG